MPDIRLNKVVLPAPLGPMMLKISLSCKAKLKLSTALRPPKSWVIFFSSSRVRLLLVYAGWLSAAIASPGRCLIACSTGLLKP